MREIKLPKSDRCEGYGKLTWSIRGIYEGYAGWYDLNPAHVRSSAVRSLCDLVKLAGVRIRWWRERFRYSTTTGSGGPELIDAALAADASIAELWRQG